MVVRGVSHCHVEWYFLERARELGHLLECDALGDCDFVGLGGGALRGVLLTRDWTLLLGIEVFVVTKILLNNNNSSSRKR